MASHHGLHTSTAQPEPSHVDPTPAETEPRTRGQATTTGSSFSGFTLSSIRTDRHANRTSSLASVPAATGGGGLFVVAASSRVDGHTVFATASSPHPYYCDDGPSAEGQEVAAAATSAPAPPAVRTSDGKQARTVKNPRGVPAKQPSTAQRRASPSASPQAAAKRGLRTQSATARPAPSSAYEAALSSFQRTIIAEAHAQRHAVSREKVEALARRAAVTAQYTRKPSPTTATRVPAEARPKVARRPAWLVPQPTTAPVEVESSTQAEARGDQGAVPPQREATPQLHMSSRSRSASSSSSPGSAPARNSPVQLNAPPPLPRGPARAARRHTRRGHRDADEARIASPATTTTTTTTTTTDTPSHVSPRSMPTAATAEEDVENYWRRRHPALHESLALVREVEVDYPLLRRLLTPPRQLPEARLGHGLSLSAPTRPLPPRQPDHARVPGAEKASRSPPSASLDTTTQLDLSQHDDSSDLNTKPDTPNNNNTNRNHDAERPWLRQMPSTARRFFTPTEERPQAVPLYRWSTAEANAAACMHGPFVSAKDVFDRATERAQRRHAAHTTSAPPWASFQATVRPLIPSAPLAMETEEVIGVQSTTHRDGPIRDASLQALLDAYFACSRAAAEHGRRTPITPATTTTSSLMESSLTMNPPPRVIVAAAGDGVSADGLVSDDVLEARTLEALLSFTTALSTPPRPLTSAAATSGPLGQPQHWLDVLDGTPSAL